MARKLIIMALILVASAITSYGCYTIIRHPSTLTTETTQEDAAYQHQEGDRDCVRCHQDYQQYPYGYYYGYYPEYYWNYPRWGSYYAYPWWWDSYYEGSAYNKGGITTEPANSVTGEKPSTRRGLEPPYSRDSFLNTPLPELPPPTFNAGGGNPPASGGTTGTATGGTVTNPPDKGKDTPKKEDTKPPKQRGK
jgi:hypothetical protein